MPPLPDLAAALITERTDHWLERELHYLWSNFFQDIPRANEVEISFARAWKTRLGLIRLSETGSQTYIGINSLLREPEVPREIVLVTIAHELVHYSHGFGSLLPRKHRHPHHGDIVNQELLARGFEHELSLFKDWTSRHWFNFYFSIIPPRRNGRNGHSGY